MCALKEIDGEKRSLPDEVYFLLKLGASPDATDCWVCPKLLDWYELGNEVGLVLERPESCTNLKEYIQFIKGREEQRINDTFRVRAYLRLLITQMLFTLIHWSESHSQGAVTAVVERGQYVNVG